MSCSLAEAGQGRLVPADGAIPEIKTLDQVCSEIYTVCQFREIITESETYMSLRSEGVNLHESLSHLGLTWPV